MRRDSQSLGPERRRRGAVPLRPLAMLAAVIVVVPLAHLTIVRSSGVAQSTQARDTAFAATVNRLSEPAGYFNSDNLISNETSYLHVVSKMREIGVNGGAYIGVGPDQNFSYIAAIRPRIAYLVDIRRDNLLQHLLFKALFERSRNRLEYLCRWLGRPVPSDVAQWSNRSIEDIVNWLDNTAQDAEFAKNESNAIAAAVRRYGLTLSPTDLETIARFHNEFVMGGLDIRFTSYYRGPRPYYPTLRQLILERDLDGKMANYLVREDDFRFLKAMQARNQIVPVTGNLAGTKAFPAVAQEIVARGEKVSALYVSNVEFYLWRDGSFPAFAETVTRLPRNSKSVIIRSFFGYGERHPLTRPNHFSTQILQTLDDFVDRQKSGWSSYWELVTLGAK
jgi:hypothetical protein